MKEFKVYSVWESGVPLDDSFLPSEVYSTREGAELRRSAIERELLEADRWYKQHPEFLPRVEEDTFTVDDDGTISLPGYDRTDEDMLISKIMYYLWQWLKPEDLTRGTIKAIVDNFVDYVKLGESEDRYIAGTDLFFHYETPFHFSIIKDDSVVWDTNWSCHLNERSFSNSVLMLKAQLLYQTLLAVGILKPGDNENMPF